jgi:glycosyltransferase involved in cell wall biosynthesis
MKVCIVHNLWGEEARGGAESILQSISQYLYNAGHEVVVITTQARQRNIIIKKINNISVYALPSTYLNLVTYSLWRKFFWHLVHSFGLISFFRIKKIIKTEKPDIVWTHNLVGLGLMIFWLLRQKNIRHFHTLHDIQLLHPSGLLMRGQENVITSLASKTYQNITKILLSPTSEIISPSKWLLELHTKQDLFIQNICQVISNPVVFSTPRPVIETRKSENFTFLYVGQVEHHKGISILIKAFEKITEKKIRLIVVGEGSLLHELKEVTNDSRIEFKGRLDRFGVREVMMQSDCLVVPSLCYENFPTVILEAMSAQLPVIGSGFGGIKEILLDSQLLFEPNKENVCQKLLWAFEKSTELTSISKNIFSSFHKMSVDEYCQKIGL